MSSLEDTIAKALLCLDNDLCDGWPHSEICPAYHRPAVLAVLRETKVVTCGECKWFEHGTEDCGIGHLTTGPDWFCADGEREGEV